jgi:hypothetical protein
MKTGRSVWSEVCTACLRGCTYSTLCTKATSRSVDQTIPSLPGGEDVEGDNTLLPKQRIIQRVCMVPYRTAAMWQITHALGRTQGKWLETMKACTTLYV